MNGSGEGDARRPPAGDLESTQSLLQRIRAGDAGARDLLVRRFLPALKSWASGRIPPPVRRLSDTDDLVQMTFIRVLDRIDRIEYVREGGFFAYLRSALRNQIRDQLRRAAVRPEGQSLPEDVEAPQQSPLGQVLGREILERYEAALQHLSPQQQAAVSLRLELGLSFQEVADAVGCPSDNAARMLVARALVRLSEVMDA